jgi:hypothetical protein
MFRSIIFSAAVLAAAATGARAADPAPAPDLRCLAVASVLASNSDPNVKNAGVMAALYYLGKLDGRDPGLDLETRLRQEVTQLSPQEIQSETLRCGAELAARGKTMNEIGLRLQGLAGKTP